MNSSRIVLTDLGIGVGVGDKLAEVVSTGFSAHLTETPLETSVKSEAVAQGEIIFTPSSALFIATEASSLSGVSWSQHASFTMVCKPVEFAGPINLTSILSRMSPGASRSIKLAKQRNGLTLKFAAGNQTTTTRLVSRG